MRIRTATTTAWIIIGITGLALILTAIAIIHYAPTDCGTDKQCFLDLAITCENAKVAVIDDRGSASLVTKDCVVTKTLTSLDNAVPEMNEAFVGKSMRCPYMQGSFPIELFDSITSGTEICEGELAGRLLALAAFSE